MPEKKKNIVVIGGGKGIGQVLKGLKAKNYHLSAVVTMSDDGGSTGILRKEFDMLPPGDIRRALVSLANTENPELIKLFEYRFQKGEGLKDHSLGNLIITALSEMSGDFEKAIEEASRLLEVSGDVIPVTLEKTTLYAKLENGQTIEGEHNIDVPKHDGNLRIIDAWLKPEAIINPRAKNAILNADMIIMGPGDLFTSIIPNILAKGPCQAIKESKAKKVYLCNLQKKFGETTTFSALDFLASIEQYLGKNVIDYFIVNDNLPSSNFARFETSDFEHISKPKIILSDLLGSDMRHDEKKLANVIESLWPSA